MTSTSPPSLAASMSTPSSFHTPKDDSPSTRAYTTGVSSPAEDELPDPKYRPAVQPVDELRSHCQIHLEEELCNSAPCQQAAGSLLTRTRPACHTPPRQPPNGRHKHGAEMQTIPRPSGPAVSTCPPCDPHHPPALHLPSNRGNIPAHRGSRPHIPSRGPRPDGPRQCLPQPGF